MIDSFNKYCAEFMGYAVDEHDNVRDAEGFCYWEYNPYDDLNQMTDVVEKLITQDSNKLFIVFGSFMLTVSRVGIKQAFRDFIISTMKSTNIQHEGEEK